MIRDVREHVPQIAFWIKPIQFSGSDQAIKDGSTLSPGIGPGEQIIFPTQSYGAQGTFGGVVVDLQVSIVTGVASFKQLYRTRPVVSDR